MDGKMFDALDTETVEETGGEVKRAFRNLKQVDVRRVRVFLSRILENENSHRLGIFHWFSLLVGFALE